MKEAFPFVEPEEHVMGLNAKFHYVPLPKLLSVLCNIPDVAANLATLQVFSKTTQDSQRLHRWSDIQGAPASFVTGRKCTHNFDLALHRRN